MNITMTGRDLRDLLAAVLPHASSSDSDLVPQLGQVTFEVAGNHLHAIATDRFTIGVVRHTLPEPAQDTIITRVAATALRIIARQVKVRAQVALDITSDGLAVEQHSDPQMAYRLPAFTGDGAFKDWRTQIADIVKRKPDPEFANGRGYALNPAYLARFRPASRDGMPLEMQRAGNCMAISCGDHFLGLTTLTRTKKNIGSDISDWLAEAAGGTQ